MKLIQFEPKLKLYNIKNPSTLQTKHQNNNLY